MAETTVLDGCAIATVDRSGTEYDRGHIVISGRLIASVGRGPAPRDLPDATYIDAGGCLATPGLVNTHEHLYQWATRGYAQQANLFEWLGALYPVWAGIDEEIVYASARAALASLVLSGCTLSTDHHYVFPRRDNEDLFGATVRAARDVGLRFHPARGSMDLGRSAGGLPPDEIVEDRDEALAGTAEAIDRFHDPSPGAMVRVAIAPCSPFSATEALMREATDLARSRGVRLHTHLAETAEEEAYCLERLGCTPALFAEELGWLGPDVWMAHCVHLGWSAVRRFAETGTGVAHCPSSNARLGAGIAPVRDMIDAGVPVGLGVDGAASNEAGALVGELRQALLMARVRRTEEPGAVGVRATTGAMALTAREVLELATIGGARCLGWEAELGSLESGKLADVAVWRLSDLGHAGMTDPIAALVLGPRPPLARLLVGGAVVVENDQLTTAAVEEIAAGAEAAARQLAARASAAGPASGTRAHEGALNANPR